MECGSRRHWIKILTVFIELGDLPEAVRCKVMALRKPSLVQKMNSSERKVALDEEVKRMVAMSRRRNLEEIQVLPKEQVAEDSNGRCSSATLWAFGRTG